MNNYQPFGAAASKMANAFQKPSYALNSVQSFYLQVSHGNAQPNLLDMAMMFAQKYEKEGHLKREKSVTDTSEDT